MRTSHFCLFDTPLGWCGIAWRERLVTRFVLPSPERGTTRKRLSSHRPGIQADAGEQLLERPIAESAPWITEVIALVRAHLEGDLTDFVDVPVDLTALAASTREVYRATRVIPPGQTVTYGEIAAGIGQPGGAQAVGAAMGRNPVPLLVPCHRVVGADGRLVGFSAEGGLELKRRLLDLEQAAVVAQRTLF